MSNAAFVLNRNMGKAHYRRAEGRYYPALPQPQSRIGQHVSDQATEECRLPHPLSLGTGVMTLSNDSAIGK
jgi:hypothetical protein